MQKADFTGQTFPRLRIGQAVLAKFISLSADPFGGSRESNPTCKGRVTYINDKHHHATVETKTRGGKIKENFKTWEVRPI